MTILALAAPLLATTALDPSQVPDAGPPPVAAAPAICPPGAIAEPVAASEPAASGPAPVAGAVEAQPPSTTPVTPPDSAQQPDVIVVTARAASPADPVEKVNVVTYGAVQAVDQAVIAPATHAYQAVLPKPARDGIHNALNNLDEPIVFVNFVLQLKPGKAAETLGRFVINSTLGLGGLFDVARKKPFNLPRRSNGLADTLGYYGVKPGPFLFLPLIGPTTLRDVIARPFDLALLPALAPKPFANPTVSLGKATTSALDEREHADARLGRLKSAGDPYVAIREEYLARRQAEIEVLQGKRKSIDEPPYFDFPETGPAETASPSPAPPPPCGPAIAPVPQPAGRVQP